MSKKQILFFLGLILFIASVIYISINGISNYGGIFIGILGVFLMFCSALIWFVFPSRQYWLF